MDAIMRILLTGERIGHVIACTKNNVYHEIAFDWSI
jgi:hypothetical protein